MHERAIYFFAWSKRQTIVMTVLPGVMCVGGVLFLHLSIMGAIILYYSSLAASLSNAMWPLIAHTENI